MSEDFPADIKQFISAHIRSVAELEAILMMRNQPDRRWSALEVSQSLYTSAEMAAAQLRELGHRGLLATAPLESGEEGFQYRPAAADSDAKLAALAELYKQRRVSVITAIYSEPMDNVRTFADAFRLRKDK
jgi:hypothetical protein